MINSSSPKLGLKKVARRITTYRKGRVDQISMNLWLRMSKRPPTNPWRAPMTVPAAWPVKTRAAAKRMEMRKP